MICLSLAVTGVSPLTVSPGRTQAHNWLRVWADTGSGSERLRCVMLWCQAWAQHGAIAASPPQPRNTRKITQYSPVSVPDRPLPATWSALKYYTGVLYFSFTYSKRPDSIKEKGFEAQKLNSNATFSRNLFFFLGSNFDNRKCANVFCILLFAGMRAKVDSEQNITSAILRPSHSPAQLIPRDERLAAANQRPARAPGDQSEDPSSPSLARPNTTQLRHRSGPNPNRLSSNKWHWNLGIAPLINNSRSNENHARYTRKVKNSISLQKGKFRRSFWFCFGTTLCRC